MDKPQSSLPRAAKCVQLSLTGSKVSANAAKGGLACVAVGVGVAVDGRIVPVLVAVAVDEGDGVALAE